MPVVTPKTLPEWQEYVSTFTGAELLSKAKAANSLTFLRAMESEGMAPQDAMRVLRMFAAQLRADGQNPPSRYDGALVDLGALLEPVPMPEADPDPGPSASSMAPRVARAWRRVTAGTDVAADKDKAEYEASLRGRYEYAKLPRLKIQFPDPRRELLGEAPCPLGGQDTYMVWAVDGKTIRDHVDIDFTMGGNPARYGYVPLNEIWIEKVDGPPKDWACTLFHELVEDHLMWTENQSYSDAHDAASAVEQKLRDFKFELRDTSQVVPLALRAFSQWQETLGGHPLKGSVFKRGGADTAPKSKVAVARAWAQNRNR